MAALRTPELHVLPAPASRRPPPDPGSLGPSLPPIPLLTMASHVPPTSAVVPPASPETGGCGPHPPTRRPATEVAP